MCGITCIFEYSQILKRALALDCGLGPRVFKHACRVVAHYPAYTVSVHTRMCVVCVIIKMRAKWHAKWRAKWRAKRGKDEDRIPVLAGARGEGRGKKGGGEEGTQAKRVKNGQ